MALNLHSWKLIYLNIIDLFLSSFWCTTFIFLSRCIRRAAKKISDFFFLKWYYKTLCFSPSWMEILLYSVSLCPLKIFAYSIFSPFFTRQRITKICCFLTSYTHQVELFLLTFLILWPFIHWTLNKRCLETWSCVRGYCTSDLFLYFRSLWNIRKI